MSDQPIVCHGCTRTTPVELLCPCRGAVCISCCQREHADDPRDWGALPDPSSTTGVNR